MVFRYLIPYNGSAYGPSGFYNLYFLFRSGRARKSKVSLARPGDGESFVVVRGFIWVCKGLFHILWAGAGGFRVQLGFRV